MESREKVLMLYNNHPQLFGELIVGLPLRTTSVPGPAMSMPSRCLGFHKEYLIHVQPAQRAMHPLGVFALQGARLMIREIKVYRCSLGCANEISTRLCQQTWTWVQRAKRMKQIQRTMFKGWAAGCSVNCSALGFSAENTTEVTLSAGWMTDLGICPKPGWLCQSFIDSWCKGPEKPWVGHQQQQGEILDFCAGPSTGWIVSQITQGGEDPLLAGSASISFTLHWWITRKQLQWVW